MLLAGLIYKHIKSLRSDFESLWSGTRVPRGRKMAAECRTLKLQVAL